MEPFKGNFSNLLNHGSSSQATNSDAQNSPSTQFPTSYPQNFRLSFLQNFHPFGPPSNYQPYRYPPIFQGAQQQDYYGQPTPGRLEGFQLQENLVHSSNQAFGFAANRSQFDELKDTREAPKPCCNPQTEGGLCSNEMCHNCVSERENQYRYVRGTVLVPCRTAMRGSFPLNGTYFQVNEVFADHSSSHNPINIPREQLWNLHRRMVYFGTSVPTIFKGYHHSPIQ
uniref:Demeter RRM-fold domain-containing protein n=1 Tax=Oryza glumipatula TaxID=40148 RepID=A0A0D9ZZX7_9ORYZ